MSDTPNIRLFGNRQAGATYIRPARQMLDRLRGQLDAGGVDSGGAHGPLADGVYCYVRFGMGVSTIGLVVDDDAQESEETGIDRETVPDFLSGVAYTGEFDENDRLDDFRPTRECAQLFRLQPARQNIKRLGVEIHPSFPEMEDENRRLTQYAKLRPTMFSGTMRKLVQLLMGYGFLPDRSRHEKTIYGDRFVRKSNVTFDPPPADFERSVKRNGVQIQYDYRFARTHGLTKGADGKWWIVEIKNERGVHAMPIELHKGSMTDRFRQKLEDMGDNAGIEAIDLFGGFPLGVPFPSSTEELEAKVRAGMILKGAPAADLEQFYELQYYSTACGWSFSESGKEAVNTGWKYGDDDVQVGEYHVIRMAIGEMDEITPPNGNVSLKRHLVNGSAGFQRRLEAALFKVDRLTDEQVSGYLRMRADAAFIAVDALVVDPIASFSASVGRQGRGNIYWPTVFCPQIKFWEPILGYLHSHDMRPRIRKPNPDVILCETVMHAFYVGERLTYVKYYKGPVRDADDFEDGFEECMYSGEWTQTTRRGKFGVPAMFYTSNIDDRIETVPFKIVTNLVSQDLGYTQVTFADIIGTPYICYMSRHKTFLNTVTMTNSSGANAASAICVPEGMREAYYYANVVSEPSKSKMVVRSYQTLTDPNRYIGWRNLPGYTGFTTTGGKFVPADHPAGCGKVTNRHVWSHFLDESSCSEYADEGEWAIICQQIEPMAYNISLPPLAYSNEDESKAVFTVKLVTNTDHDVVDCKTETALGYDIPYIGYRWFRPSPDPETFEKDYIYARANALGTSDVLVYCSDINEFLNRRIGATEFAVTSINHNYVGVFNV